MTYYLIKLLLTSTVVVVISEVAKRSTLLGAVFASVPLVSILALTWLYFDTRNLDQVARLSINIFWLVLPSLSFFVAFPVFLKNQLSFALSMVLSLAIMIALYLLMTLVLQRFGLRG